MEIIDDNERKRKKKKEIISPLESETRGNIFPWYFSSDESKAGKYVLVKLDPGRILDYLVTLLSGICT